MITFKTGTRRSGNEMPRKSEMVEIAAGLQQRLQSLGFQRVTVSHLWDEEFAMVGAVEEALSAITAIRDSGAEYAIRDVQQVHPSLSKY